MSEPVKAPPGHIIDDQGRQLPLTGVLPITKDNCVVCPDHYVYHPDQDMAFNLRVTPHCGDPVDDHNGKELPGDCYWVANYSYWESDTGASQWELYDLRDCYSTREAAEAARAT
jgi:hypothetical protein